MKIGLRTLKTAISAPIAIFIAQQLHLLNPASAGIIAILSLTSTKRSTLKVGFERLLSLTLALVLAFVVYHLVGYNALGFGLFLLVFITLSNGFKLNEGIAVNSVLISQFIVYQEMTLSNIINAYSLMMLGVGCALLANLYMPDLSSTLRHKQQNIDQSIQAIIRDYAKRLASHQTVTSQDEIIHAKEELASARRWAKTHTENHFFSDQSYFQSYFSMRELQLQSLERMANILREITVEDDKGLEIAYLLEETANEFSEENDGKLLLDKLQQVLYYYRQTNLPSDRQEFEYRANLFQLLLEFEHFLEIKKGFLS
ncbi:aromatic acid exporter family protein [Vagococcus xieshaowenii]|uniref:Aromatic acid exporter family protein n=1 Tax=Vagococcus xieshaowenii TaxID=2562451 RepID=A0A4Z0D7T6_9ENTE|nr:aromatic acid exporter family protein [Vagococcus xieshaowenii]QCA29078.1 aromatic acid exporter family protein [Vagococcus xieshaowenii]TFZ40946.1 aromatic acid exporter family protein [Vagococcus xieshaowenii]